MILRAVSWLAAAGHWSEDSVSILQWDKADHGEFPEQKFFLLRLSFSSAVFTELSCLGY